MAKFPINLKQFKKVASNKKKTVLEHPSGHKFIISHHSLTPELRTQLDSLPLHKPSLPSADDSKAMEAMGADVGLADGGQVPKPPQKPDTNNDYQVGEEGSPGQKFTKAVQDYFGGAPHAEGGMVSQNSPKSQDMGSQSLPKPQSADSQNSSPALKENDSQDLVDETQNEDLAREIEKEPRRTKMADGGGVTPPPPPADLDASVGPQSQDQAVAADSAPVGSDANPQPAPNPTTDPALARKRELYNFAVAELTPSSGANPRAVLGPNFTFGPNGEAPAQFNPAAWNKAEQAFELEQKNKASAAVNAANAAMEENKARQAAGLPPLPVPQAAAQVSEATQEAPKAGNTPEQMGSVSPQQAAPTSPNDPFGTQAYLDAYSKGLNEVSKGMSGEAAAQQKLGQSEASAIESQQKPMQDTLNNYNTHLKNLNKEYGDFVKDIQNQHIDPNHYLGDMSTGGKIATGIGLILGGIGSGMTHGPNMALEFLNRNIDRDIDAQKANLGKKETLLSANLRQFGNLRDATDMTRAMMQGIISNQIAAAQAKAQGPLAAQRLQQAKGQLDMQSAPVLSQIAMRKTLLGGMQSGHYAPEQVIRMIVPPQQQAAAFKELQDAQTAISGRDNLLSSFDQLSKVNTIGNRVTSPLQSPKQTGTLRDAFMTALSKATAGRVTPQDLEMISHLFPSPGDSTATNALRRSQLIKFVNEKMHYPLLQAYGINLDSAGRYAPNGRSRIPESAPVIPSGK